MNKKRSITIKVVLLLAVVCLAGFFTACAKKRTVVFDSCGGTAASIFLIVTFKEILTLNKMVMVISQFQQEKVILSNIGH